MNTSLSVTSGFRSLTSVALIGATLALAACGDAQNWDKGPAYVSIGGTVSGLTGTVGLKNNGQDSLTISADGAFAFGLSIANGDAYAVTVSAQPNGQVCTVTNGSGTATAAVTSVVVDCKSNVTIGGTISGLDGTIVLQNNGGNSLATTANGPFAFTSSIANGAAYSVTIKTQPLGQTCLVTNASGTATANVTDVAVTCEDFTLRPLPEIYATGNAVNYSAFRAGGPNAGEVPSPADILVGLALLRLAGFNLLRLFGADDVSEKILRLARDNFPEMKFQQGMVLFGIPPQNAATCRDDFGGNESQIERVIALANEYDNVVAVSVGNEQSFFSRFMPIPCLESFITRVRSNVTQPVTSEDDWTFYAGLNGNFGDRAGTKPDTILPLLDFVAIHSYAILNDGFWNWQQTGTPAGPARAEAMMNASLDYAQDTYDRVAGYLYRDATGATVSIGATLPITVGETGWKAVQTNPASAIESYAANPVNQKWYYDLMRSWERTATGPATVFFFVTMDEAWKGIDDGWGLWDEDRNPRYALCGTPAGPACNADLYEGAGYFGNDVEPPGGGEFINGIFADDYTGALPDTARTTQGGDVGFFFDPRLAEGVGATYSYGGVAGSAQDPGGVPNFYFGLGLNPPAIADAYFGAFIKAPGNGSVDVSGYADIIINVWGPDQLFQAGTFPALDVILQGPVVGGCGSPSGGSEVRATFNTTGQGAAQKYTLPLSSFAITTACSGETTVAEVLADIVQINILLLGTNIQYVNRDPDGVAFTNGLNVGSIVFDGQAGGGGGGACVAPNCVDFSSGTIAFGPFENGGGGTVEIATDPTQAGNNVVKFVKKPGDGDYFGTTILGLGGSVVLTPTAKTVSMRVWSPEAGTNFLLKFEGGSGGPAATEKDAATTLTGEWETLSFVMPDAGTYTTVVLFPNGRSAVTADKTMYVDDLNFPDFLVDGGGGGGGFVNGIFADDYLGDLPATARSVQGGDVGFFFDPRLAVGTGATYDYAGVSGTAQNPGGVPNFYYGLGLDAPAINDAYFGAFVKAPENGTVDASGFANLVVNVWGPDQLFQAGTFPTLEVVMQGPAVAGCGSPSGASEIVATFNATGQGAAQNYTLPLAGFAQSFSCDSQNADYVLANLAQINIVLKNTNIQYVNKDPDGVAFTNGLNVGTLKFTN